MSKHALVHCYRSHYQPFTFNGIIDTNAYNKVAYYGPSVACAECAKLHPGAPPNTEYYANVEYDPTFTINRFHILKTEDSESRKKVLDKYKFVQLPRLTRYVYDIVWVSPEGFKIVFMGASHLKTQKAFVLVPDKHPIIKEFEKANKEDNAAAKNGRESKPKIIIPKVMQDACGEDIKVGDWVAFSSMSYTALQFGKIAKFNPKSVSIKPRNGYRIISGKDCSQIIKVPDNRAMLWEFED